MSKKKQRPSVEKFKIFVKKHPKLTAEIRKGTWSWQSLFEEWYLLGEDHEKWAVFREEAAAAVETEAAAETKETKEAKEAKSDLMGTLMNTMKNMDMEQIQQHIGNISQALGAIQGVISQFQGKDTKKSDPPPPKNNSNPFVFRKD